REHDVPDGQRVDLERGHAAAEARLERFEEHLRRHVYGLTVGTRRRAGRRTALRRGTTHGRRTVHRSTGWATVSRPTGRQRVETVAVADREPVDDDGFVHDDHVVAVVLHLTGLADVAREDRRVQGPVAIVELALVPGETSVHCNALGHVEAQRAIAPAR